MSIPFAAKPGEEPRRLPPVSSTDELGLRVFRPGAVIGANETKHAEELDLARHTGRDAPMAWIAAQAAIGLVREVRGGNGLIFRRERRLAFPPGRLGGIAIARTNPDPLAFKIGIFRLVKCTGGGARPGEHRRQRKRANQASVKHNRLPDWQSVVD
jgi:hypothetical protein